MTKNNVAVITGASSGLGCEFVKGLVKLHPEINEYWLIARRKERMEELASTFSGIKFKILPLDLSDKESFKAYEQTLETEKPNITILVNNAGYGKLGDFDKLTCEEQYGMADVNMRAMIAMTRLTLDYMKENAVILNTCSIAAFLPNPRMAVYSSTKAFVFSFSKALREELKARKINVLACCPGPMDTEFLPTAGIDKGASPLFDFCPRVNQTEMAEKSIIRAYKGKAVYTNKFMYKLYRVMGKLLPHNWLMHKFTA